MLTKAIVLTSALAVASAMATAPMVRAAGQDPGLAKKGEALYGAQKCQICHAIAGTGNKNNPLDKVGAPFIEQQAARESRGTPPQSGKYSVPDSIPYSQTVNAIFALK